MEKLTIEKVKENINKKYNGKISILSTEYIGNKVPLHVYCNDCHHDRFISYNKLSIDSCCPFCSRKNKRTTEEFKEIVSNKYPNNEYTLVDSYINTSTKIKIKHNTCNNIFLMSPSNFINGHKCPKCSHGSVRYTLDEYKKIFKDKKYDIKEIYVNERNDVLLECKKCHKEFTRSMLYSRKVNHLVCPGCSNKDSIAVNTMKKYFKDKNISFKTEIKFPDLVSTSKTNNHLRIDFYLEDFDIYLEFDGRQHFESGFKGNDLETLHKHDIQKNEYFSNKNLQLYRIKYNCFANEEKLSLKRKDIYKNFNKIVNSILLNKESSTTNKIVYISNNKLVNSDEYYIDYVDLSKSKKLLS